MPRWLALTVGLFAQVAVAQEAAPPQPSPSANRAAWISDSRPLKAGDFVTVLVDEQTSATERTRLTADARRKQNSLFGSGGTPTEFGSSMDQSSTDRGDLERRGGLLATMTARVTAMEPGGFARIEGQRRVIIDGRPQDLRITGFIRPHDVSPANVVHSSRIAEAEISYNGKKISPRSGIIGKLIGIFWP